MQIAIKSKWIQFEKQQPPKQGSYLICYGKNSIRYASWWKDPYGDYEFSDNGCGLIEPDWWAKIDPPGIVKVKQNK